MQLLSCNCDDIFKDLIMWYCIVLKMIMQFSQLPEYAYRSSEIIRLKKVH